MKLLLDTHAFLWILSDDPRLGAAVRTAYVDRASACVLSVVSIWEMAIKASMGKLTLDKPLREVVTAERSARGIDLLVLTQEHALAVRELEFHHRDPFDRALVAQALTEGLSLASRDPAFDAYGVKRTW